MSASIESKESLSGATKKEEKEINDLYRLCNIKCRSLGLYYWLFSMSSLYLGIIFIILELFLIL